MSYTKILVAGVHGSGTTWVFNVIRMFMCWNSMNPISGWLAKSPPLGTLQSLQNSNWVMKTHGFGEIVQFIKKTECKTIRCWRVREECIASVRRRTGSLGKATLLYNRDMKTLGRATYDAAFYYTGDVIGSAGAIRRIADLFGFIPSDEEVALLEKVLSKESVREFVKTFSNEDMLVQNEFGTLYEKNTLFQQNHIG